MEAILSVKRDPRVDILRGAALLMIFIDHIPGNLLGWVTFHVFGFADAAEIFVLLAGFASMLAYGKVFLRSGSAAMMRKVAQRCLRIYLTHAGLLLTTLLVVLLWTEYFHVSPVAAAPLLDAGFSGLVRGLALNALPGYLDILPLYILLLMAFPVLLAAMRWNVWAAMGASAALWVMAQLDDRLNLPNWLDPDGWYFDPFSWQFLFAVGALLALVMAKRDGALPRRRWLTWLSAAYLVFAFLETFPFVAFGLPSLKPIAMDGPDKTHFSVFRLLDILAWVQIVFSNGATRNWVKYRLTRPLEACGRHSLDIFALGCVLALFGRLVFRTFGRGLWLQGAVNLTGLAAMCLVALWLEHRATRRVARLTLGVTPVPLPHG